MPNTIYDPDSGLFQALIAKERTKGYKQGEPTTLQLLIENFLEKVTNKPSTRTLAQATTNVYLQFPLGIDISHYQTTINWKGLKGRNVDFVIAKCGEVDDLYSNPDHFVDSMISSHLQGAYDAEIPAVGAYYFLDGGAYWLNNQYTLNDVDGLDSNWQFIYKDPHIVTIVKALHSGEDWLTDYRKLKATSGWKRFHFIVLDIERWWLKYNDWYTNGSNAVKISPVWINFTANTTINRLQKMMDAGLMPKVPIVIYTRKSFIDEYSPQLDTTAAKANVEIWPAHWYWRSGNVKVSWEDIKNLYLPPDTFKPALFGNKPAPKFWQWSGDRFVIPEISGALDLNFYWGTKANMLTWLGLDNPTPPPPPPPPPQTDLEARVAALESIAQKTTADIDSLKLWGSGINFKG